tara:strand:- start:183 stop:641 length:459 start_codon:yes stop_codon:yes gene_type:complete
MKFGEFIRSIPPLELVLFGLFVLYIIFPVSTPSWLIPFINSSFGLAVVFFFSVYLLLYTTPILGFISIFVAYELLRRSAALPTGDMSMSLQPSPVSQSRKDSDLQKMNPPSEKSLEEQVIDTMAPVGKGAPIAFLESDYKPVSDKINGGSLV